MQPIHYGRIVFSLAVLLQSTFAADYTVSKGAGGQYTSVQAAINEAHAGDRVVILDASVYEEQVTIDSTKDNLVLCTENPTSTNKPTIKWQDRANIGPADCDEAKDTSKITFDRNAALRVLGAANVRIEGIAVDGGGPFIFGSDGIWKDDNGDCKWPMQHGNAAITLWVAGDVMITDCDIRNAYFGIHVKDRNEGGIFANANPGDVYPENVVPLSGFARTGNHLIEYNRIHDNSVGIYFESAWDMGSTIRYNLIFENHHKASIIDDVKNLTSEGGNQVGGAFMFKDQLLSPLAIYNNTLWHNFGIFTGNWNASPLHLIFNNIIGAPYATYDRAEGIATNLELLPKFPNRIHHCVIAAHHQAPSTSSAVQIVNGLQTQGNGPAEEGALVVSQTGSTQASLPASAEVRWVETPFMSTDPDDEFFLVPNWADPEVDEFILDKGWPVAGIKDQDGSMADLGAIPKAGGRPAGVVTIRPSRPMVYNSGEVNCEFEITPRVGTMGPPDDVYFRFIHNIDTVESFGIDKAAMIAANQIATVTFPATPALAIGSNKYQISVPNPGTFGFFEVIVEGVGPNGIAFTSAVGFIPYRKLDYYLEVEVRNKAGEKVSEVRAGDPVVLHVEAFNASGSKFTNKIDPTEINLQSRFDLLDPAGGKVANFPNGITGTAELDVMFTRVPAAGALEIVHVTGSWVDANKVIAFMGSSDGIKVLPGDPDSILFQRPRSHTYTDTIDPGTTFAVTVAAFDKYGNQMDAGTEIKVISQRPNIGTITDTIVETAANGIATFRAMVTNGDLHDTIPLLATLIVKPERTDIAGLRVGQPRDRLWIFFSDTLQYDETVGITACSGVRVPIVVRASKNGQTISTGRTTTFDIQPTTGLLVYDSDTARVAVEFAKLTGGEVRLWVKASVRNVSNGEIILNSRDPDVVGGKRGDINFVACFPEIERAVYSATNPRGAVDRVDIYYTKELADSDRPDTLQLSWPNTGVTRKVLQAATQVDPADRKHLIVMLAEPFAEGITRFTGGTQLGISYWTNPQTPDALPFIQNFDIQDGVGPLLGSAVLVERLKAGNDTLIITFTETIDASVVKDTALTLIKTGKDVAPIRLTIIGSRPYTDGVAIVAVVEDNLDDNRPQEGDSLMITPYGSIVDQSANMAHPQNRPVVITLKNIAPDIVTAEYRDNNADGTIETVRIRFNKTVNTEQMYATFTYEKSVASDYARVFIPADETKLVYDFSLEGLFGVNTLRDKTEGTMKVDVIFADYGTDPKTSMISDSAAPVIDSVEYHIGQFTSEKLTDSTRAPDTLYVRYTDEVLKNHPAGATTFPVILKAGPLPENQHVLYVTDGGTAPGKTKINGKEVIFYRLIVSSRPEGYLPAETDSVWINTDISVVESNARDAAGNVQRNPANRRVEVVIVQPPLKVTHNIVPVPFDPRVQPGVTIMVRAKMDDEGGNTEFSGNLFIYDKVGNMVRSYTGVKSIKELNLIWDGRNQNGRIVGDGTYVSVLQVDVGTNGRVLERYRPQPDKIGVKQKN